MIKFQMKKNTNSIVKHTNGIIFREIVCHFHDEPKQNPKLTRIKFESSINIGNVLRRWVQNYSTNRIYYNTCAF